MERPKGAFLLPRRVVRRSISPQKGEKKLKAQLARRRENEGAWLFKSLNQNFGMMSQHTVRHTRA
jgi:hypothetical protein